MTHGSGRIYPSIKVAGKSSRISRAQQAERIWGLQGEAGPMNTRYPAIRVTDQALLRQRYEALSLNERPWNLVYGCQPVSEACKSCFAQHSLSRFHVNAGRVPQASEQHRPVVVPAALAEPARWTTPQQVTVAPLADLFQPEVPAGFVSRVIQ